MLFLLYILELEQWQVDWQLYYCFYDVDSNVFVDVFSVVLWCDWVNVYVLVFGSCFDLLCLFVDFESGIYVYICGLVVFNEVVKVVVECYQVFVSQLYFEQFIFEDKSGEVFILVLVCFGCEFIVLQDMIILQVIENNKVVKVECLC